MSVKVFYLCVLHVFATFTALDCSYVWGGAVVLVVLLLECLGGQVTVCGGCAGWRSGGVRGQNLSQRSGC